MLLNNTPPTKGGLYIIWLGVRSETPNTTPSTDSHYFYVGRSLHCQVRWGQHHRALLQGRHKNRHMQAVFNKHGVFEPEVLLYVEPEPDQMRAEQAWLDEHYGKPGCVNLSDTADSGWLRGKKHTEETKQKMRGRVVKPETREHLSSVIKGRPLSESHRQAIKEGHKDYRPSPQCVLAATQANRDRVWTKEMREKNSKSHTGLKRSETSKRKQQETWKAGPENIQSARMRANRNRLPKGAKKSEGACRKLSEAAKRRWASQEARKILSDRTAGRVWVTNDTVCKYVHLEVLQSYLDLGWRQGRPRRRGRNEDEVQLEPSLA